LNLQVRTISKNRQLAINILASYIALFVQMGISFFLSPYIVRTVGVEAYGFVQFSYVLISYFAILSVALNSMSSRFIMVSCFRGDFIAANKYFASTFYANVILGAIIFPVLAAAILNIAKIINVPAHLLVDVQFLMGFMAVNFVVDLLATNLGISYYVSNKLYLFSLVQVYGHILRAVLLIGFFTFFEPYVAYIGLITLIITIFTQSANIYWKRRLIPDLNINRKFFDLKKVKELISSGVWNSITRLGQILQDGLDLLIANLMLIATAMGILAVAKIIPNVINMILHAMISTFLPDMTELYAKQKYDELVKSAKRYMKITGMIINIPIALLIAFGDILYALWFPTQDSGLLQLLSVITVLPWAIMGQTAIIHNIFTIVNKIRVNSILVTITGFLNVLLVLVLLKTTSLGLFAVAGVSSVLIIIRNLGYTLPFGALYLNRRWTTFFPETGKSVASVFVISAAGLFIKSFLQAYSWSGLFVVAIITVLLGLGFNFLIVFNKDDRIYIFDKIRARMG
jgi:O-antigen/teichoic acid export membrane protein